MKDFCGRELNHNDLVVSKPSGRGASMRYGLIRDEFRGVWFGPGSVGGSDVVLIETDRYPYLEKIRIELIGELTQYDIERTKEKEKRKNRKIKKSHLKRFGVYQCDNDYDREIYLGRCRIRGKIVENVWMSIKSKYKNTQKYIFPESSNKIDFWEYNYYSQDKCRSPSYRSVKYPQKFVEVACFTESDMIHFQQMSRQRMKERDGVYHGSDFFIEIIFK